MQILSLARKEFFHQRHAQALGDAALDLALDQRGIDRTADIMRSSDLQHTDCTKFLIDLNLSHVRAESEDSIRRALPILIQGSNRWIKCRLAGDDVSVRIERQT